MRIILYSVFFMVLALGAQGMPSAQYYAQSIAGHIDLMQRTVPITHLLNRRDTPPELKRQLAAALEVRQFATNVLALPENGSYRHYADLGRKYVVWNVYATPTLSLRPVTNCFPIAGCVTYRGYFSEADAQAYAQGLRDRGFDVHISGAVGYSTLNWFDDPILNTMVRRDERRLVRLIFHELAHQKLYVQGDSAFNEAFATTVANEGYRRWVQYAQPSDPMDTDLVKERSKDFTALILKTQARLKTLYHAPVSDARKRTGKAALFERLKHEYALWKTRWGSYNGHDDWIRDINNAKILSVATYHHLENKFERILDEADHDMPTFYETVAQLANLPQRERYTCLNTPLGTGGVDACLRYYSARTQVPNHT